METNARGFSGDLATKKKNKYVVIGGGIAGVSCAQELGRIHARDDDINIVLVAASEVLKEVRRNRQFEVLCLGLFFFGWIFIKHSQLGWRK
jgi:hypothetical protein